MKAVRIVCGQRSLISRNASGSCRAVWKRAVSTGAQSGASNYPRSSNMFRSFCNGSRTRYLSYPYSGAACAAGHYVGGSLRYWPMSHGRR